MTQQHNLLLVLSGKVSPDNQTENKRRPAGVQTVHVAVSAGTYWPVRTAHSDGEEETIK